MSDIIGRDYFIKGGNVPVRSRTLVALWLSIVLALCLGMSYDAAFADATPQQVVLSANQLVIYLAENKNASITASVLPSDASQTVEWSTSDRAVARVSRGKITGYHCGSATITAYSKADRTILGTCSVTVRDSSVPEKIVLSQNRLNIDLAHGSKATLTAKAEPAIANQRVRWKTSSSAIARVSSSGVITARKPGSVTIQAISRKSSAVVAECQVTVTDTRIPASISFEGLGNTLSLDRYQTYQLTPVISPASADQNIVWKSSRSSVVSVSKNGLLTAKSGGSAVITCYSKRSKSTAAVLQVNVHQYPSPTAITLSPNVSGMEVGSSIQLTPVTSPANQKVCQYFTWKTSSSARATVSKEGVVTAKKTGWVTITCTSKQNSRIRASRKILIVTPDSPREVRFTNEHGALMNDVTYTIHPAEDLRLTANVLPAGKNPNLRWRSSRTSVATVDQNGLIHARKAGTATITATSSVNGDVRATMTLKVVNLPAPDGIELNASGSNLELTDTLQLTAKTLPAGEKRSQEIKWRSSNTSVARVSESGLVTPRKLGTATITATSARNSRVKATFVVHVIDSKLPDYVRLAEEGTITIENGQRLALTATVAPSTAVQTLRWSSSSSSRVSVDGNGVVTGIRSGTATITVSSAYNGSRKDTVKVKVTSKPSPSAFTLQARPQTVMVGKSTQLTVVPTPADASVLCTYSSSNQAVATVDANGVVTAHAPGTAIITARSSKNSSVYATLPIVVYDENTPGSITLSSNMLYLTTGSSGRLSASVFPATAPQTVTWSSSNPSVAAVSADGLVSGRGVGTAVISARTSNGLTANCQISVTSTYVATAIPARTTDISGIEANLKKIDDIRQSALNQITMLAMQGTISPQEAATRRQIIDRAFEMQAFPWMTESTQPYWSSKYAYKKYEPGNVYYGLPYIQTAADNSYKNREYNVAKAVSERRYVNSGKGYYVLNRNNLLRGMYVGNDCSAFVNIAEYGINHSAAFLKTYTMDTSSYYKTVREYSEMRPGDFMVLRKSHTVMFLYWVDAAKTRMMIIEQGGDGNTVICSIHDLSYYSSQGYIVRRRASF